MTAAQALLEKAARSLHAAKTLLDEGDADFAVSRSYYGMFYAAEALLLSRELRFRRHGSVHAAFGEHFVKAGLLDATLHRWLLDAFDQRILGDYGTEVTMTVEDAKQVIDHAEVFVNEARRYLGL
jgi:uncharacterized protein (UPF0332 family)